MTLREKFRNLNLSTWINYNDSVKCEKISDNFAIGFAEWSVSRAIRLNSFKLNKVELETYKKEKGL